MKVYKNDYNGDYVEIQPLKKNCRIIIGCDNTGFSFCIDKNELIRIIKDKEE